MEYSIVGKRSFNNLDEILELMPKNYLGYKIVPHPTTFVIFQTQDYRLEPLRSEARGYNMILYPDEQGHLFAEIN